MIPAGYMLKRVLPTPDWLHAPHVAEVCSVSGCFSEPFADYTSFERHNGFWLFDRPDVIERLAIDCGVDISGTRLFYYEAYEREYPWGGFREGVESWRDLKFPGLFPVDVELPSEKRLLGFDVIAYGDYSPECSPLSCNSVATNMPVNRYCLFSSFDEAKEAIDGDVFEGSEMGVYRIFAVYELELQG